MPQCVSNNAPVAFSFVPGMLTMVSSVTMPIRLCSAESLMFRVKSEGTQAVSSVGRDNVCLCCPPVVTTTSVNSESNSAGRSIFLPVRMFILCLRASRRKQSMIALLSCAFGKTHSSGCATSGTPWDSNHSKASCGENCLNSRFSSVAPRGYAVLKSFISANVFVQLHLPPPDMATFRNTLLCCSKMYTSTSLLSSLSLMPQKNPAAPPPIIATRLPDAGFAFFWSSAFLIGLTIVCVIIFACKGNDFP